METAIHGTGSTQKTKLAVFPALHKASFGAEITTNLVFFVGKPLETCRNGILVGFLVGLWLLIDGSQVCQVFKIFKILVIYKSSHLAMLFELCIALF